MWAVGCCCCCFFRGRVQLGDCIPPILKNPTSNRGTISLFDSSKPTCSEMTKYYFINYYISPLSYLQILLYLIISFFMKDIIFIKNILLRPVFLIEKIFIPCLYLHKHILVFVELRERKLFASCRLYCIKTKLYLHLKLKINY